LTAGEVGTAAVGGVLGLGIGVTAYEVGSIVDHLGTIQNQQEQIRLWSMQESIREADYGPAPDPVPQPQTSSSGAFSGGGRNTVWNSDGTIKLSLSPPAQQEFDFAKEMDDAAASFLNKNNNAYVGPQGVYQILIDGSLWKFGKADLTSTSSTGLPTRLQSQLNALQAVNPNSVVTGNLLYTSQKISILEIKSIETQFIQRYYDQFGKLPPDNLGHPGVGP
jgi:hypothetical protein